MGYTTFDRLIAWRRFCKASPKIGRADRICDVGCGSGAPFLRFIGNRVRFKVGIDEHTGTCPDGKIQLIRANITKPLPLCDASFEYVSLLAVLEHLESPHLVLTETYRILRPGGSIVMTWPNAAVDPILAVASRFGLVHKDLGIEQHQPRIPRDKLLALLSGLGFRETRFGTFEFGFNNLLVATKEQ